MKPKLDLSHLVDAAAEDGELIASVRQREQTQELMQNLLTALGKPQPAPQVHIAAPEIPAPVVHIQPAAPTPKPVLDWTFTFERNKDGSIKSIRAKAT